MTSLSSSQVLFTACKLGFQTIKRMKNPLLFPFDQYCHAAFLVQMSQFVGHSKGLPDVQSFACTRNNSSCRYHAKSRSQYFLRWIHFLRIISSKTKMYWSPLLKTHILRYFQIFDSLSSIIFSQKTLNFVFDGEAKIDFFAANRKYLDANWRKYVQTKFDKSFLAVFSS